MIEEKKQFKFSFKILIYVAIIIAIIALISYYVIPLMYVDRY